MNFPRTPDALVSLACGSVSGFVSATVTYPVDLVRRRMQLSGKGSPQVAGGFFTVMANTVRQEGVFNGLYRGIVPEYGKVIPGMAIAFFVYESVRKSLGNWGNCNDDKSLK